MGLGVQTETGQGRGRDGTRQAGGTQRTPVWHPAESTTPGDWEAPSGHQYGTQRTARHPVDSTAPSRQHGTQWIPVWHPTETVHHPVDGMAPSGQYGTQGTVLHPAETVQHPASGDVCLARVGTPAPVNSGNKRGFIVDDLGRYRIIRRFH